MGQKLDYLVKSLTTLINYLEKERFNLLQIFILFFTVSLFRAELEALLFGYYNTLYAYVHQVTFFFCGFLGVIFIIRSFTKEKILKLLNLLPWASLLLIIVPILDRFIFHRTYGYGYLPIPLENPFLILNYIDFLTGVGQRIMILFFILVAILYIYIKTHSILKASLGFISLGFFILLLAFCGTIPYQLFNIKMSHLKFFLLYFFLSIIFILLILRELKKSYIMILLNSLRPIPTTFLIMFVLLGTIISCNTIIIVSQAVYIIIGMLVVLFVWWFTVIVNHVYDFEIDKVSNPNRILTTGMLTIPQAINISMIFAIIALGLSFLLSLPIIPIGTGITIVIGYIYSAPPIRLRNKIFSPIIIGLACSLAFAIGYITPLASNKDYFFGDWTVLLETPINVIIFGIIIFISFSLSSTIKDLKDVEGDKKFGVENIFTVYGKKKGITIVTIFLAISFILPTFIFHNIYDLLILIAMGILTIFLFKKYEKINITMIFLLFIPFYCLFRLVGLL